MGVKRLISVLVVFDMLMCPPERPPLLCERQLREREKEKKKEREEREEREKERERERERA